MGLFTTIFNRGKAKDDQHIMYADRAPTVEIKELKFKPKQRVWMMWNNKPTEAPISEVHLRSMHEGGVTYYFWHQDFIGRDKSICYSNQFSVSVNMLYATREELMKSIQ